MAITDAIILAGGFGTRLRPLTTRTPKPLLSVGGRPFLETLFARLAQAGVKRAVLSVHHNSAALGRALPKLRNFSLKLSLKRESAPLGTGGAIGFAWPDRTKPCLVLNGDALSDFDVRELQLQHRRSAATATIWAIPVEDTSAFGVLETAPGGRVVRFVEKPRPGETPSRLINAGLYALEPSVLKFIEPGRSVSVEREVFPRLLEAGLGVVACEAARPVYWLDIGNPTAYLQAHRDLLAGKLWGGRGLSEKLWGRPDRSRSLIHPSARVAPGAKVGGSVLGPDCVVEEGAVLESCVLLAGARVGAKARLQGAVLAEKVRVGANCELRAGVVLGAGSTISEDTKL